MQVFANKEKIGVLSKTGNTTVQLTSSVLTIGAKQYNTSNLILNIDTIGAGGMEVAKVALTFYYVYAVIDSAEVKLIASTSSVKPSAYGAYRKVGAFYTDSLNNAFKAYRVGIANQTTLAAVVDGYSGATATAQSEGELFVNTVNYIAVGNFAVIFNSDVFAERPAVTASNQFSSATSNSTSVQSTTDSQVQILTKQGNALANTEFTINAERQGVDAIQPDWTQY